MSNKNMLLVAGIVIVLLLVAVMMLRPNATATTAPSTDIAPSTPATSQPTTAPVTPQPENSPSSQTLKNNMHRITLETSKGRIQFETYDADAPKTAQNFITLAQKGFYNNLIFHRVIKGFMIQGGDPSGNGTGGPGYQFEDELNLATESYKNGYKKGIVAMANAGPNTNGSQFFIMLADYALPNNYTIFGHVVKGQEVVDAIGLVKTDPGDKPTEPVVIKSAAVETITQ